MQFLRRTGSNIARDLSIREELNAGNNFRKTGKSLYFPCESSDKIRAAFYFSRIRDINARLVRLFSENIKRKPGGVRNRLN